MKKVFMHTLINTDVGDISPRWSDDFKDFVKMCLKRDPNERWTIERLLFEHPFLAGIDVEQCKAAWIADV